MKRGKLTKREISMLKWWRTIIRDNPRLAAAHAAWISDEFTRSLDELKQRVFKIQEAIDELPKRRTNGRVK